MLARLFKECSLRISRSLSSKSSIFENLFKVSSQQTEAGREMNRNMKEFILEPNTPFHELDCKEAFDDLTETERKYLHFYTKVSLHFSLFTFWLKCHYDLYISSGLLVRLAYLVRTNISRVTVDFLAVSSDHCS